MGLIGTTNADKIWNYLQAKINNPHGTAGLMGNLEAESGFNPINLQNTYNTSLRMSDERYTKDVDNGTYNNFIHDKAGYGLAQWTYWSRKENLYNFAKDRNKSIGDLEMQLDFLWNELQGYKGIVFMLQNASSVREASDYIMTQYERPADQSEKALRKRAELGEAIYKKYNKKEVLDMGNSSLVTYTNKSPNRTSPRNHKIDTITIHCYVGQVTAKEGCDYFATVKAIASANYVIGHDGSIGLSVEEKDRAWTSSSKVNDNRAVTIEVASEKVAPYKITDAAMKSLILLCADICRRNNIKKLVWSTNKTDRVKHLNGCNMTVHRDFAAKACPGAYLYERHGYIADEVNRLLSGNAQPAKETTTKETVSKQPPKEVKIDVAKNRNKQFTGAYKTTADLRLRAGAGTSKAVLVVMPKGTVVRCFGYYNRYDNTIWLYVQTTINKITYSGYCSKNYLNMV